MEDSHNGNLWPEKRLSVSIEQCDDVELQVRVEMNHV